MRPYGMRGVGVPRKIDESTGRLPPTPIDHTAANEHRAIKLGDPPAERANTPVIRRVRLNEILEILVIRDQTALQIIRKSILSSPYVRSYTPESSTYKETDVLAQF
jgi:hypothetical protein